LSEAVPLAAGGTRQTAAAAVADRPAQGAWLAAFILMLAYALSWMDRSLPSVLIEPMKASLHVSDTRIALVTGFAFALCHATLTLPLSWFADRWDRAKLILIGVAIWSLMTSACAFAPDFWSLFVCRMGVGVGEAVLLPSAYSLIADLFPLKHRAKGLMVLVLGNPIGSAAALTFGGLLYGHLKSEAPAWALGLDPWRAVFLAVGAAGLVIAVLMLWLPEPRRRPGGAERPRSEAAERPQGLFAYLGRAGFFLVPVIAGVTVLNLYAMGSTAWQAPLFSRTFGWSLPRIGALLGPAVLISGLVGAPLGAWLIGAISRWRKRDASVTVLAGLAIVLLPIAVLSPLAPSGNLAFAGVAVGLVIALMASVAAPSAVVNSAPAALRARVSAIYLFIANLIGAGGGPAIYALATDQLFRDPAKLNLSMATVSGVLLAAGFLFTVIADRGYNRALRIAEA
jgi:MFS family permease